MGGLWPPLGPFTLPATTDSSPRIGPSEKSIVRDEVRRLLAGRIVVAEAEPKLITRRWRTKAATPREEISIASFRIAASSVRCEGDGIH